MKKLLLALALLLIPAAASAQCNGVFQAGTVCGVGVAEQPRPPHSIALGSTIALSIGVTSITGGTSNGILFNNGNLLGNTAALSGALLNTNTSSVPAFSRAPIVGVPGTATGTLGFGGATSGTATITPQAVAGTPTLTLPNTTGTFAVGASSPMALNATTGNLTCATCVTSSGGGAITGVAPVAVSAAGAVSVTGSDGAVLWGTGPAFTQTPTLGTAGTSAGSLAFANATSGTVTIQAVAGALGAQTISLPAATGTVAVSATAPITLSATGAIGLTTPLALNFGGTNANLTASNGGLVYSTASAFAILSGTATANQIPLSGSSAAPAWSTATYPATTGAGTVLASASANTIAATSNPTLGVNGGTGGSVILNGATSGSSTIKVNSVAGTNTNFQLPSSNGVSGQVLSTDGSGNTSWASAAAGGTVTSVGTAGILTGGPITASGTLNVNATITPQGRLTLTSGTPVLTSTVSAATTVYYTPYVGNLIPLYDGTNMIPTAFAEVSQATTDTTKSPAAVVASKIYDVFCWSDSGTNRCTRGPAWTSSTTRGYTLTMTNGILLNTSAITNGPAALRGTWVGTIGSNGTSTIDWILGGTGAGGVASTLYVWNAYNRVIVSTTVSDNNGSWSIAANTIQSMDASTANRISYLTGAAEDAYTCQINAMTKPGASGFSGVACGYDSTTAISGTNYLSGNNSNSAGGAATFTTTSFGAHFFQALDVNNGANAATNYGNGTLTNYLQSGIIFTGRM